MSGILSNHLSSQGLSGFYEKLFSFTQNHLHWFKIIRGGKGNIKKSKYHPLLLQHKKTFSLEKKKGFKQYHLSAVTFLGGKKEQF